MTQQVGKYQLIRKLARGGMAEVFLARSTGPMGFQKTLVLKRILPHLASEPRFVQMFLSEAQLAARLSHSRIAQIFDFGEADGEYFLAMEYIDGPSLRTLLRLASEQGKALPPALCARLVADACEGLAFAHDFVDPDTGEALGLVHRDVSPDNLLLSRQGEMKVVDFGIAKAAEQSEDTKAGTLKGKLAYMAPEQVRLKPLDRRTDVYALGVVLYELLTGRRPFEAESEAELMHELVYDAPKPLARLRPELPAALQPLIDRALAKERDRRYPDCAAFQADLEQFILSTGKPVTPQSIAQYIARFTPGAEPKDTEEDRQDYTPLPSYPRLGEESEDETGTMVAPLTQVRIPKAQPPPPARAAAPRPVSTAARARSAAPRRPLRHMGQWLLALGLGAGLGLAGLLLWPTKKRVEPVAVRPPPPPTTALSETSPFPAPAPRPPAVKPREKPAEPPPPEPETDEASAPADPPVRVTRSPVSRAPRPPPPPGDSRPGMLTLRVWPYATVFVDGRSLGETPIAPTELSAGRHQVKLVNEKLSRTVTRSIEVKPGRPTLLKVNLLEE